MPGTVNLDESERVNEAIEFCSSSGKLLAAICAAPMIYGKRGLLSGKSAVCFPGFEEYLEGAKISDNYVVTDDNIITAKGMGSAVEFGLAVVSYFKGAGTGDKLRNTLQCYR